MTHQEYVVLQERAELWFNRAALVLVPTAKVGVALALVHLVARSFGLRTQSPRAAAALLGLLWLWWAWKRFADATFPSVADRLVRRRKAREADARGHCVIGSNCPVCRGMPSKPDGES